MEGSRIFGLLAIIPTMMLITVSFFVMFTVTKVEKSVLRIFGMVVVGLLWVTALVVFTGGVYLVAEGPYYFGDRGVYNVQKCPCCSMSFNGGMRNSPYHKRMMNMHEGLMDPHAGLMDPHAGMMNNPHQGMMDPQSSAAPDKNANPPAGIKK